MNEQNNTPKPNTVNLPAEKITALNIDEIKPNTVLIINLNLETQEDKMNAAPAFAKLLAPFANTLREKKVTIMMMALNENISLVTEEEMNKAGWFKKQESLIINPFDQNVKKC